MKQKTSRTISFGQMRPKLKCLAVIYSFMLGPNHTHLQPPHANFQHGSREVGFELVLQPWYLGTFQSFS